MFPAAMPMRFEIWDEALNGYETTLFAERVRLRKAWLAS